MNSGNSAVTVIVVALLVVLCCCLCFAMFGLGSLAYGVYLAEDGGGFSYTDFGTATPVVIRPTAVPTQAASGDLESLPDHPANRHQGS